MLSRAAQRLYLPTLSKVGTSFLLRSFTNAPSSTETIKPFSRHEQGEAVLKDVEDYIKEIEDSVAGAKEVIRKDANDLV